MNSASLQKIKKIIQPHDKIIMAKKNILRLDFPVEQNPETAGYGKPSGLWYAVGTEWIDWVETEMPKWLGDKFYKIETTEQVLKIDAQYKFNEFVRKYGVASKFSYDPKHMDIDWAKVAKDYAGIEIAPYRHSMRHEYIWYYGWDVASGCIWNKSGIKSLERIYLRKPTNSPKVAV